MYESLHVNSLDKYLLHHWALCYSWPLNSPPPGTIHNPAETQTHLKIASPALPLSPSINKTTTKKTIWMCLCRNRLLLPYLQSQSEMSSSPRIKAACVWAVARSALGSLLGSQLKWQMMHSLGEHAAHMDTRLFTDSKHTREGEKKQHFKPGVSPLASCYRGRRRFNQIFNKRDRFCGLFDYARVKKSPLVPACTHWKEGSLVIKL